MDYADNYANYPTAKALYQFVAEGTEYINDKELKLRLLRRVLANLSEDSKLDNQLNALAISAGRGLSVKDFEPLADNLVKYAKKNARRIESYVLINLSDLLSLENRRLIYGPLEKQALRDANLAEAYAVLIREEPNLSMTFKQKLLAQKDVWQSGAGGGAGEGGPDPGGRADGADGGEQAAGAYLGGLQSGDAGGYQRRDALQLWRAAAAGRGLPACRGVGASLRRQERRRGGRRHRRHVSDAGGGERGSGHPLGRLFRPSSAAGYSPGRRWV